MKKIMFMAAIVAVGLSSCSTNQVTDDLRSNEISFSNLNDRITRAANQNNSDYKVYADDGTKWFMDGDVYSSTNVHSTGKKYFWPADALDFYAFAPAVPEVAATLSATYPDLSLVYTVNDAADEDFTIATPIMDQSTGQVDLKFNHMLSKVTFSVSLDQNLLDAGYTIDSPGTAIFKVVGGNSSTANIKDATWDAAPTGTEVTYSNALSYMFMPQTSTGCTIAMVGVKIKHGGTTFKTVTLSTYTIAANQIASGSVFAKNQHYAIDLKLTDLSTDTSGKIFTNEIKFTSEPVSWADVNVGLTQP